VKDVFAKEFFGAGRDAAAGPGSELQIRILMPDGRFRELSGNPARVGIDPARLTHNGHGPSPKCISVGCGIG
jgi:hypothetical protein